MHALRRLGRRTACPNSCWPVATGRAPSADARPGSSGLVARHDVDVVDVDVARQRSGPADRLCDIVGGQVELAGVHLGGLVRVTVEAVEEKSVSTRPGSIWVTRMGSPTCSSRSTRVSAPSPNFATL